MYKIYIYTYTDEIGKKKKNKNHDAPAQSFSSYVAYMYISGRPSHFTAKRNIAFTIYHHPPRIFFFKSNPLFPILSFPRPKEKKKKKRKNVSNPTNPLRFQLSSTAIRAHIALPLRFSSMFDGYAVFYLVMFILSLYHHVISAREMIREAMRSRKKKKKKKERKKKWHGFNVSMETEWNGAE